MGDGQGTINSLEDIVDATVDMEADNETHFESPDMMDKVLSLNGPWSAILLRKADKLSISEDDSNLRRSCRMRVQNKGLKGKEYAHIKCFACDSDPPTISPCIIKNRGISFCN